MSDLRFVFGDVVNEARPTTYYKVIFLNEVELNLVIKKIMCK